MVSCGVHPECSFPCRHVVTPFLNISLEGLTTRSMDTTVTTELNEFQVACLVAARIELNSSEMRCSQDADYKIHIYQCNDEELD